MYIYIHIWAIYIYIHNTRFLHEGLNRHGHSILDSLNLGQGNVQCFSWFFQWNQLFPRWKLLCIYHTSVVKHPVETVGFSLALWPAHGCASSPPDRFRWPDGAVALLRLAMAMENDGWAGFETQNFGLDVDWRCLMDFNWIKIWGQHIPSRSSPGWGSMGSCKSWHKSPCSPAMREWHEVHKRPPSPNARAVGTATGQQTWN